MAKEVEFFFDYGSPTSYLAYTQMPGLAARTGATVIYRPMLLGGVFKATGNQSPAMLAAKSAWMGQDMMRFAARYGVPFRFNPYFPINTLGLMRGAMVADRAGELVAYSDAIFQAIWVDGQNMAEAEVVARVLAAAGLDPATYRTGIEQPAIKAALKAQTEEAVERGCFGAPTCFVGAEMHFGQDRLDFIEAALTS